MATSVIASWLQTALLTFSFHSLITIMIMHAIALKVIIVVTKILATILAIPGYS